ncbi:MAG: DUF167 family protein [Methanobrevibacter sp.]|uniref:DUF167 family protein n=1 Tax=Methanobrevibacter sp. TaxID=66852 RepID=UPI0026DFC382|nr:DUF167 family protein [Methanobrevibacter sp.]MDO5849352.1 DUF167 family protein [Methanobrevibacter sp.]
MSHDLEKAITDKEGNVLVDIEVSPNSKKFEISDYNDWRNRIEIRIKQVPQKGKANKEICKELSNIFDCDVAIFKGEKSSQKTVIFKNSSKEAILNKFLEVMD